MMSTHSCYKPKIDSNITYVLVEEHHEHVSGSVCVCVVCMRIDPHVLTNHQHCH